MLDRKEQIICLIQSKVVSEKTALLNEGAQKVWVFKVRNSATKPQVAEAVKKLFGETAQSVNLLKIKGKRKQVRRRWVQLPDWKKAYVTLSNRHEAEPIEALPASESKGV